MRATLAASAATCLFAAGARGADLLGDVNLDDRVSVADAVLVTGRLAGTITLPPVSALRADVDESGTVQGPDLDAIRRMVVGREPVKPEATTFLASPHHGEGSVAVTRETILRFDYPIAAAAITASEVRAEFGGATLPAAIRVSPDRTTVTLFYEGGLPGGARVRLVVEGDRLMDRAGRPVDADRDGAPGGTALIDFDTLGFARGGTDTVVCGRVFASELAPGDLGSSVTTPLEGATITVDGAENISAVTDATGSFRMEAPPIGTFFVHVDGRTAVNGVPPGSYYPYVGKPWTSVAGTETNVGDVYLPLVEPGTLQPVSQTEDTTIRFAQAVIDRFPQMAGVSVTVPAGSLYADDGSPGGMVGIAPVPPDRLPGKLPPELDFPIVITVQTDGATNFATPVAACFPNLPDPSTGVPVPPGGKTVLWSFSHDAGRWEAEGSMTVSADGALACTDPGVGITQPGWHGFCQCLLAFGCSIFGGGSGTGGSSQSPGPQDCPPGVPRECCTKQAASATPNPTDPLNLFSGEMVMQTEDMRIRGVGMDFVWTRTYRSQMRILTEMGAGWDWSYNIRVEPRGDDMVLMDGASRDDVYERQPDGTWSRREMFRVMTRLADGSFVLTFEDKGRWEMLPLDGRPAQGRIAAIVDRHGNALAFAYDASGRLAVVTDTLGRDIVFGYGADGFFDTVTDFTGRVVRYDHFGPGSADGSPGDLRSATTPAVTGTPNGNDFPDGKTTSYTYTRGFADDRLNHGLLSITDGRRNDPSDPTFGDGPFLTNVYADVRDPAHPDFDRIVRQIWGGSIIDVAYVPQNPSAANHQAVLRTIVNDRVGNVIEYWYDARNRVVAERQYTGRAAKTGPTTDIANRPAGKLRATDPEYFETLHEYNQDSLETRTILPNGNVIERVYEADINPSASPRTRGNLRILRQLPGTHVPAGDQPMLEETFEYDTDMGACCGFNFVTRHVDARGNETLSEYDLQGNPLRVVGPLPARVEESEHDARGRLTARVHPEDGQGRRRRDELEYHDSGPMNGYLAAVTVDAGGLELTTRFETDARGNVVRMLDPRGNDSLFTFNQLDELVRETSREVTPGSGLRHRRDRAYDANGNLARIDVENIGPSGQAHANQWFTTTIEYETLDRATRISQEVEAGRVVVEEMEYDANRNLILLRSGEAVAGRQPTNVVRTLRDERNLPWRRTRGAGDPAASTTQHDYDANGNVIAVTEGLESAPRVSTFIYDGYDRLSSAVDAMGNVATAAYDPAGNRIGETVHGEVVDVPGAAGNVRLLHREARWDALDRPLEVTLAHFDPRTGAPIGDGASATTFEWAAAALLLGTSDDNGHGWRVEHDSAWRRGRLLDARGNSTTFAHDANGNVVAVQETELSDMGNPPAVYTTTFTWDGLDRLERIVDNAGNLVDRRYDSRGHLALVLDARRASPTSPGNATRYEHDGLGRLVAVSRELRAGGTGAGALVGTIDSTFEWDDASRPTASIDANGHATRQSWDPLDREALRTWADGSTRLLTHDVHDNVTSLRDENGSIEVASFDLLNRLTRRDVTPGPGVSTQTTFERFTWDGLSRLVRGEDDDSVVERSHDSLGNVVTETQNGLATLAEFDGVGNMIACTHPDGRRVSTTFDELDRPRAVSDAAGVVGTYSWAGRSRREQLELRNGVTTSWSYDTARRVADVRHAAPGGTFDRRLLEWDQASNLVREEQAHAGGVVHDLSHDSIGRLARSIATPGAVGAVDDIAYSLDGASNRVSVSGGELAGAYVLASGAGSSSDAEVNQYSTTPFDVRTYDEAGNLTGTQGATTRTFAWDFRNRLVAFTDSSGAAATYRYDVFGRRIAREVAGGGATTRSFFVGWREIEERDAAGAVTASHVPGAAPDEILASLRPGIETFPHADHRLSVVALTDSSGNLVERYAYSDFGVPEILDPSGAELAASAVGNDRLFLGRPFDAESGLVQARGRMFEPPAGRFISRDPLGPWGDPRALGNAYAYAGSSPWTLVDRTGLEAAGGMDKERLSKILGVMDFGSDLVGGGLELGGEPLVKGFSGVDEYIATARRMASLYGSKPLVGGLPMGSLGFLDEANRHQARLRAMQKELQVLEAAEASKLAKLSKLGTALDVIGFVGQAGGEFLGDDPCRGVGWRLLNAGLVGGTDFLVGKANPVAAVLSGVSGAVDMAFEHNDIPKPGVFDVIMNAPRALTSTIESAANGDTRAIQRFVDKQLSGDQGAASWGLAQAGDWLGDKGYDVWNYWSSGQGTTDLGRLYDSYVTYR